ncbi:hypothetical protein PQO03_02195 [Lentisphaera profundi]|uniref:DUF4340 domain-containing protein n=1 Tax=Lentisphaera profundi TaxID=1658616 RepID=A0ABY7VRE0_9BACT|nr:hypothetical protein [Lentisphaera profundi]WDE96770.1 hypothetical protein PQO03_02195 [Lentisphaera profundi]
MKNIIYALSAITVILIVISPKLFTKKDEITVYNEKDYSLDTPTSTKTPVQRAPFMMSQPKAENGGLIALVAETPKYTWFIKIIGSYQGVKKQVANLEQVANTLDLAHGDHIHYDIPKDWVKKQASAMRIASFDAEGVDISISRLPSGQDLNANVLRWKKQIGLSGAPTEQELSTIKDQLYKITLFNEDKKDQQPSKTTSTKLTSQAPFASGSMPAVAANANAIMAAIIERPDATWFLKLIGPDEEVRNQANNIIQVIGAHSFDENNMLKYDVPADWKEVQSSSSMRIASYKSGQVDISLIKLGPNQNIDANVARWKGQVGISADAKLENEIKSFNIQGNSIHIVKLINDTPQPKAAEPAPSTQPPVNNPHEVKKLETLELNPSDKWIKTGEKTAMSLGKYELKIEAASYQLSITQMQGPMPMQRVYEMWFDQMGLKGKSPKDYIEKIKSTDGKELELIKISNDKEILISASFQGTSKIFFKLQGPASKADLALEEFKTLITSARFK